MTTRWMQRLVMVGVVGAAALGVANARAQSTETRSGSTQSPTGGAGMDDMDDMDDTAMGRDGGTGGAGGAGMDDMDTESTDDREMRGPDINE